MFLTINILLLKKREILKVLSMPEAQGNSLDNVDLLVYI